MPGTTLCRVKPFAPVSVGTARFGMVAEYMTTWETLGAVWDCPALGSAQTTAAMTKYEVLDIVLLGELVFQSALIRLSALPPQAKTAGRHRLQFVSQVHRDSGHEVRATASSGLLRR